MHDVMKEVYQILMLGQLIIITSSLRYHRRWPHGRVCWRMSLFTREVADSDGDNGQYYGREVDERWNILVIHLRCS
jgi:hypothetical protein